MVLIPGFLPLCTYKCTNKSLSESSIHFLTPCRETYSNNSHLLSYSHILHSFIPPNKYLWTGRESWITRRIIFHGRNMKLRTETESLAALFIRKWPVAISTWGALLSNCWALLSAHSSVPSWVLVD